MIPEYDLRCSVACSLREGTPWGRKATELLLSRQTYRAIVAAAAADKYDLNMATLARHKKHIIVRASEPDAEEDAGEKPTNIAILEAIIKKGFANRANWKPTIGDTMKAMDMWFRLTQGNPFDELLDTLAEASADYEPPPPADENPAALATADEQDVAE